MNRSKDTKKTYDTEREAVWNVAFQWAASAMLDAHTSGSTGTPKHIRLPMDMVRKSTWRTIRFFRLDAASRLHSCVSARFIGGKMMVIRALELGCRFTYEPSSNRPHLDESSRIDLLAVVPSMMWDITERHKSGTLPEIRNIIVGGAPIPDSLRRAIAESGLNAYETYGMTETASHIALRRIEADQQPFSLLDGIAITTDERGCLVINLEGCPPVVTNDIASILSGNEFRILGRADNAIITGGRKVFPEDIERRIAHLIPGDFIITSRPSDKWGQELLLRCPSIPGYSDNGIFPVPERLKADLEAILEPHERPHALLVAPVAYTANGKPVRNN